MVVFTCNHCGDSLQKPRVEKHYNFVCRTTKSLTCIDCLKDFRGEEYESHTKCLTEEERYAAKGAYANGIVKKGEVKQESWIEMIKSIIEKEKNLKPPTRNLLNTISNYSNVPRKKTKFLNFIKSSSGGRANIQEVENVWNIIEKYKIDQQKAKEQNGVKHPGNNIQEPFQEPSNIINNNENNVKSTKKKKAKVDETVTGVEGEEKCEHEINQEQIKSEKKKNKSENETIAEEKIDINNKQENDVKEGKRNKSKKSHIVDNDITENLTNGATEGRNCTDEVFKIEDIALKKKSKKKQRQDLENEDVSNPKKPKLDTINGKNIEQVSKEPEDREERIDFMLRDAEMLSSKQSISKSKKKKQLETETNAEEQLDINNKPENEVKTSKKHKKSKKSKIVNSESAENFEIEDIQLKKSKKKKIQHQENEGVSEPKKLKLGPINGENIEQVSEEQKNTEESFDFKDKITEILSCKGSISVKKLEKKVINSYLKHFGLAESSPKILKKYNRKLKNIENIEIVDHNVILKT